MEANELMIGDFIYQHHPKDNTPHIVKVSIDTLYLMDRMEIGFIQEQSPLYRIIEPIPLTPEMLDRNGFTNTGGGTYTKMFNGEHYLIYVGFKYHTIDALMSFGNTKSNQVRLNNCGMYLHELQHVLRLCGIDKEIVL